MAGHPNPAPIRNIHGQIVRANMENRGGGILRQKHTVSHEQYIQIFICTEMYIMAPVYKLYSIASGDHPVMPNCPTGYVSNLAAVCT